MTREEHYAKLTSLARTCRPRPEAYEFVVYDGTIEMAKAISATCPASFVYKFKNFFDLRCRKWEPGETYQMTYIVEKGDYLLRIDGYWILVRKNQFDQEYVVIDQP